MSVSKVFNIQRNYLRLNFPRKSECHITRLRLMHTRLNAGLLKLRIHKDGTCPECGLLQDSIHLIMKCPSTSDLRNEIKRLYNNSKPWTFKDLMSDLGVISIIVNYVTKNNHHHLRFTSIFILVHTKARVRRYQQLCWI